MKIGAFLEEAIAEGCSEFMLQAVSTESQASPAAVAVSNLHKRFGALEVLKGIDLTAQRGEVVAIIGGSGSGKSTLLRCINFLETPSAGDIAINGESIATKVNGDHGLQASDKNQLRRIRSRLAMVFQSFNLWQHRTVIENVVEAPIHVLGIPKAEAMEKGEALLERVGLAEKRDNYPAFLSGGQQQRAAIARALAVDPEVMLFDEPTSALDPELVGEVLAVIADLAQEGRTMLLVTHEMKFARDVSSKVIFLHQGLVEEEGDPQKVFYQAQSERCRAFVQSINR